MACIICRKPTEVWHDQQFNLDYHYCGNCDFIAQDRGMLPSFLEEREEYDRHENTIENEGYVTYFKNFLDSALIPYADLDRGLDYGSGPEPVLSQVMVRDYGARPDIYDLHYQPEEIYQGKKYDYIVHTEVIEHIQNPLEILRLFHELLDQGGVVAIMTLFHPSDEETFMDWWYRRDITHISFFTVKTFKEIATRIGFDIIYTNDTRYITLKKV